MEMGLNQRQLRWRGCTARRASSFVSNPEAVGKGTMRIQWLLLMARFTVSNVPQTCAPQFGVAEPPMMETFASFWQRAYRSARNAYGYREIIHELIRGRSVYQEDLHSVGHKKPNHGILQNSCFSASHLTLQGWALQGWCWVSVIFLDLFCGSEMQDDSFTSSHHTHFQTRRRNKGRGKVGHAS